MSWLDEDPLIEEAAKGTSRNLSAFLRTLREAEGADYDTLYGGGKFQDFTDHPLRSREIQTQYGTTTSAAGGYQFQRDTWNKLKDRLKLKDFSPENQDKAAIELLKEAGALEDVEAGKIEEAVRKVAPIWASLPGNKSGQPSRSLDFIQQTFARYAQAQGVESDDPELADTSWLEEDPESKPGWGETLAAVPGTVVGMLKKALGGAMQNLAETDLESQIAAERGGRQVTSVKPEFEPNVGMAKKGVGVAKAGEEQIQQAQPEGLDPNAGPESLDFWKRSVISGVANVAVQAPALAAGVLTRSPVIPLAAAGLLSYETEYGEQRAAGIEPEKAGMHAGISATGEVLTELLPAKFLTEAVPGKVLKSIVSALAADIPGELVQTTIQSVNAKYSKNPNMTWEEYGQDLLDTLGTTLVASPLLAGGAGALTRIRGEEQPEGEQSTVEQPEAGGIEGQVNGPLTDPTIDAETLTPDSSQLSAALAEMNAIDPDSIGERELEESRKIVEEFDAARKAPPVKQAEVHWPQLSTAPSEVVDIGELGATSRQAENAEGYINTNVGDRLDRSFSFATDENAVGLTPRQILPKPGTYVLGEPTTDRPAELLQPLMQTMEGWRQEYMPNSTLVVSNEQLFTDSALGWHYNMGEGKHLIVPAVLRKAGDLSRFNVNTQAGVFYNAAHEFGHALFMDRLMQGIAPELQGKLTTESRMGVVGEGTIQQISDPLVQEVLKEYNEIRARIMDNSMTAQEFTDTWLGPAKRGREYLKELGVAPEDTANAVMRAVVRRAVNNSRIGNEMSKREMQERLSGDFFSLDEYFAEQMARYAYKSKKDQQTPLGKYLERGLASLRKFFTGLKSEGVVAPGVKFSEWIESLPQTARLAQEAQEVSKTKQKAGKKKMAAPKLPKSVVAPEDLMIEAERKQAKKKPKKKVEKVRHNEDTNQSVKSREQVAKQALAGLIRKGILTREDNAYQEMQGYIERQEWDELTDMYQDFAQKAIKFETDGNSVADNDPDWNKQFFASPKLKAWFGDWENNPELASVAREGVFDDLNDGTFAYDKQKAAPPLVSFTSLGRLQAGENVFHASTVRGTMFTDAILPQPGEGDPSIVPVVLNIRNPLIVADPQETVTLTREQLQQQGYDGIVYRNDFEGHVSFVVFSPEQIKLVPRGKGVHMELDHDAATPEGNNGGRFYGGVKNFLKTPGPMRRALRKVMSVGARYFLQIQQIAHLNPQLEDLQYFSNQAMEYTRDRSSLIVASDRIVGEWKEQSRKTNDAINKVLFDEFEGGEHWFELEKTQKVTPESSKPISWTQYVLTEKAEQEMKKRGIDTTTEAGAETARFILRIKNDVMNLLNEAEQRMMAIIAHRYGNAPGVMLSRTRMLRKTFQQIREVPFFPQARFGDRVLIIRKKRESGPGYEVVSQEHFEDEGEWLKAIKNAQAKKSADEQVIHRRLTDEEYVMINLPAEFLDTVTSELGLSEAQATQLEEILQPIRGERMLSQFDKKRLGVKGYSRDGMRAYANWVSHFSNQISKMKYRKLLNLAISGINKQLRVAEQGPDRSVADKLANIRKMMAESRDYMMSPPTEYQAARAAVSIAYLWANVKTASINFFGLMTTYFNIARKYGNLKGDAMFMRAVYNSMAVTKLTSLNDIRQNNAVPAPIMRAIDRATREGVTTQSYQYHLAHVSHAHMMLRNKLMKPAYKPWQKLVDLGMLPFRFTEIATRRIAFMVAMEGQLQNKNLSFEEQYQNAVKETALTQNDYTLANRVKVMRGWHGPLGGLLPMATIFATFAQHMTFHSLGGYEIGQRREIEHKIDQGELPSTARLSKASWTYGYTARLWLLLFLLAGYEGMPLMENVLDLVTGLWRKLGGKKPIRQELRELVQGIDMDPMLLSRGLMHDVMGFDLSRSVGMGRVAPGTETFAEVGKADLEKSIGGLAIDGLGVAGSVLKFGYSLYDKGFTEGMLKAPGGVGNIYTSLYWSQYGVRGPNDALIHDPTNFELAAKALGFNPTAVSSEREKLYGMYEVQLYWRTKRSSLLEKWDEANWKNDPEEKKIVREGIRDFNLELREGDKEFRRLQITGNDLGDRESRRRKLQRDTERGIVRDKRTRAAQQSFRRSFDPPEGEPSDNSPSQGR